MPREFHLYSKADGTCALKVDAEPVRDFPELLGAIDYIRTLPDIEGATITIYDALGNATLRSRIGQ